MSNNSITGEKGGKEGIGGDYKNFVSLAKVSNSGLRRRLSLLPSAHFGRQFSGIDMRRVYVNRIAEPIFVIEINNNKNRSKLNLNLAK